jgi:predicted RNA binding protein YcfA (HicA-like mRNA interferase family)
VQKDDLILTIPSPHEEDIGITLLEVILRQAGLTRAQ